MLSSPAPTSPDRSPRAHGHAHAHRLLRPRQRARVTIAVLGLFVLASAISVGSPAYAAGEQLWSIDFEDSTTGAWTQHGGAGESLSFVADPDDAGNTVMAVVRDSDYVGIESPAGGLNPGQTYTFTMRARLADPAAGAAEMRFVAKPAYTWIGNTSVSGDAWTTVTGEYTVPAGDPASEARVYIGSGDASAAGAAYTFLVDDVVVTTDGEVAPPTDPEPDQPAGPAPSGVLIETDFEDGLAGWGPRADAAGAPSVGITDVAHGGAAAAAVTERLSQGSGLGQDVTDVIVPGVTFEFTAWVRFADGQEPGDVWLTLRRTVGGSDSYDTLAQFTGMSNADWVEVSGTFTPADFEQAFIYLETAYTATNTSDFYVDDIVLSAPEPLSHDASIEPLKDAMPFPMGVAIDARETRASSAELLLHHFGQVTAENHMKPEAWYDGAGNFTPSPDADAIMTFAQANGLDVYGHTLVWHSQTPAWFFQDDDGRALTSDPADQQILRDRMRTHIDSVAGYLAAEYGPFGSDTNPVVAFDVVNEVITDEAGTDDGMRRSEWYAILGEEFVDDAFAYAEEAFNGTYAAPGADRPVALFINDYNSEIADKQVRYVALVERLVERGVPIDGVGHQFHLNPGNTPDQLEAALAAFEPMGLKQAVTELDWYTGTPVTDDLLALQGDNYRAAFEIFANHADQMFSVTVWGLIDSRSWRNAEGAPLLFDDELQAKPAYFGAIEGAAAGAPESSPPIAWIVAGLVVLIAASVAVVLYVRRKP